MKLLNGIKKIRPLFKWKKCHVCGHSFVRESGWKLTNLPFLPTKEIFICKDCIQDIDAINTYVTCKDYIPKKRYLTQYKNHNPLYERRRD